MCAEIVATFDDPKTIAMASGLRSALQELLDIPTKTSRTQGNIVELQRRVLGTHLDADTPVPGPARTDGHRTAGRRIRPRISAGPRGMLVDMNG